MKVGAAGVVATGVEGANGVLDEPGVMLGATGETDGVAELYKIIYISLVDRGDTAGNIPRDALDDGGSDDGGRHGDGGRLDIRLAIV